MTPLRAISRGLEPGWGEAEPRPGRILCGAQLSDESLVVTASPRRRWRLVARAASVAAGPTARVGERGRRHRAGKCEQRECDRANTSHPGHSIPLPLGTDAATVHKQRLPFK
jgi:hypothetical protein